LRIEVEWRNDQEEAKRKSRVASAARTKGGRAAGGDQDEMEELHYDQQWLESFVAQV
jgi:hypothetical protein